MLRAPTFAWGLLIWGVFTLVVGSIAAWSREQPLVAVGRVMRDTRTVNSKFEVVDELATEREREKARVQAPRVYVADAAVLEGIRASIESLPKALADADTVEKVEPSIREQFALTPDSLAAVQRQAVVGEVSAEWARKTRAIGEMLLRTPLLDAASYQVENTTPSAEVELRLPGGKTSRVAKRSMLAVQSAQLSEDLGLLVYRAGFTNQALIDTLVARIKYLSKPTYVFDAAGTTARQEDAAAKILPQTVAYADRHLIFRRGDTLRPEQLALYVRDKHETALNGEAWQRWSARLGMVAMVGAAALALAGYTILFVPRIRKNPARLAAAAGLMAAAAAAACISSALQPALMALTVVAPTMFVSVILSIAYDRRVALAYGLLHAIIVCAALSLPVGWYALVVSGVGASIWQLGDIRERDTFVRMGALAAVVVAVGMMIVGITEVPVSTRALRQAAGDAGLAGFAALMVGGVTLFILPTIERVFDITTGMTLVELRDPKQPLLRQLQQRAPGTYNHSLNVASLAEAAADAIGADSLLTYVGALYHDIGKMNKPDYFVENQLPGLNKHDKLNPAMSLLIIVGHVKDGIELAREFGIPRALHHFIEAHHGTTLVEFFYHRARRLASAENAEGVHQHDVPEEAEYRYPGPRPRTKECAILMLCDAIESASRALADPTPSRIDALVHAIATKRLTDGQFDECDLTLRELNVIVEAVSRTLAAVYHGRIAYPTNTMPTGTISGAASPRTATFAVPSAAPSTPSGSAVLPPARTPTADPAAPRRG